MATSSEHTAINSRNRLRFLQHLCRRPGSYLDDKPDAILCVPGPDGRFSKGTQEMVRFLVLGQSGRQLHNGAMEVADEALEECVFLLSCDAVSVFYPAGAAKRLAPHLAVWRNCAHFRVFEGPESENTEAAEMFKIKAFIAMVKGHERIGVPLTPGYTSDPKRAPADPTAVTQFEVEDWPLVQAFGLADMGTGGFFTMLHKIVDVRAALDAVYASVDAHYMKQLCYDVVPTLAHHWETFMNVLSHIKTPSRRLALSEEVVGNGVTTMYHFGRVQHGGSSEGASLPDGRGSRVLFGVRTNGLDTTATSADATIGSSGIGGTAALHLTAEAEDPQTGVRVARSYFLRAGDVALVPGLPPVDHDHFFEPPAKEDGAEGGGGAAAAAGGGASSATGTGAGAATAEASPVTVGEDIDEQPGTADARFLRRVYACLVSALSGAIAELGPADRSDCPARCLGAAFDAFAPKAGAAEVLPADFDLAENLTVTVDGFDAFGEEVFVAAAGESSADFNGGRLPVYVRVAITDLPSQEHPGKALGGLVVADTVVVDVSTAKAASAAPFNLTAPHVPYEHTWVCGGVEEASVLALSRGIGSAPARAGVLGLGDLLAPSIHGAQLLVGGSIEPVMTGSLRVCSAGLAFVHDGRGSLPISMAQHVEAVDVVAGPRAARVAGVLAPGGPELEAVRATWAEDGFGPGESRARDDPFPRPDDVLVMRLREAPAHVPAFSSDPSVQMGARWLALLLPAASQRHSVQQAVLAALPGWQEEVRFAKAMAMHEAPDDESAAAAGAASTTTTTTVEHDGPSMELPAELGAAYAAGTLRAWRRQWACRAAVEECLLDDASRRVRGSQAVVAGAVRGPPADTAVPVTIVLGAPGSGKSRFAAQMAETSGDDNAWRVLHQPMSRGIAFRPDELAVDIAAALDSLRADPTAAMPGAAGAAGKRARIAVVAAGYADVAAVARAVTFTPGVYVSGCVSCLHVKNLYADHRHSRWLPRLLEQCSRGWVHHVALCGCEDVDEAVVSDVKAVVRLANPDAELFRLSGGLGRPLALGADTLAPVLSDAPYWAPRSATLRRLACPGWDAAEERLPAYLRVGEEAAGKSMAESALAAAASDELRGRWREVGATIEGVHPLDPDIDAVAVTAPVCFDRRRLQRVLSAMVRPTHDSVAAVLQLPVMDEVPLADIPDPAAPLPAVWRAKGFVRFTDAPTDLWQLDAVPGIYRLSRADRGHSGAAGRGPVTPTTPSSLLLVGKGLDAKAVRGIVLRCRPRMPVERPLRDAASLTPEEKEAVRRARLQEPLPEGYWFDGNGYMEFSGHSTPYHPEMPRFVDEHFEAVNAAITAYNGRVAAKLAAAERELAGGGFAMGASDAVDASGAAVAPDTPWWSFKVGAPDAGSSAAGAGAAVVATGGKEEDKGDDGEVAEGASGDAASAPVEAAAEGDEDLDDLFPAAVKAKAAAAAAASAPGTTSQRNRTKRPTSARPRSEDSGGALRRASEQVARRWQPAGKDKEKAKAAGAAAAARPASARARAPVRAAASAAATVSESKRGEGDAESKGSEA